MTLSYALFIILGFIAVVLLLEGAFQLWSDTRSPEVLRVQRRLRVAAVGHHGEDEVKLLKQRVLSTTPAVQRVLLQLPKVQLADRLLVQAGSTMTVANLLSLSFLIGFMAALIAGIAFSWPWLAAVLAGLGVAAIPLLRLVWLRSRRLDRIGAQLPDALDLISRALRAGHAFSSALGMVAREAHEPIAGEFKTTFDEINFGISMQNALMNLAHRVPITDLRYFVVAVLIQRETGGNLAELLSMLANLIRERWKLLGRIRVLAAEGRLSAYILVALPFVVGGAMQLINPGYLALLFSDPSGPGLIGGALVMMAVGCILMWRIINIRV